MKYRYLGLVVFILWSYSCSNDPQSLNNGGVKIEDYFAGKYMYSSDSIYIDLQGGFSKDTVEICIGKQVVFRDIISTDPVLGLAYPGIVLGVKKDEPYLIRYKGRLTPILTDTNKVFIGVSKLSDSIMIYLSPKPFYYN